MRNLSTSVQKWKIKRFWKIRALWRLVNKSLIRCKSIGKNTVLSWLQVLFIAEWRRKQIYSSLFKSWSRPDPSLLLATSLTILWNFRDGLLMSGFCLKSLETLWIFWSFTKAVVTFSPVAFVKVCSRESLHFYKQHLYKRRKPKLGITSSLTSLPRAIF